MSTETKNANGLVPEEENKEEMTQNSEQEKTIFGKIDDKIMSKRAAKAAKKEAKTKAKEQKASEGKKFSWQKVAAIGAGVVGTVGTVLAVIEHNQLVNQAEMCDSCCGDCVNDTPAVQEPVVNNAAEIQEG